jgi:hypothetical protein
MNEAGTVGAMIAVEALSLIEKLGVKKTGS